MLGLVLEFAYHVVSCLRVKNYAVMLLAVTVVANEVT